MNDDHNDLMTDAELDADEQPPLVVTRERRDVARQFLQEIKAENVDVAEEAWARFDDALDRSMEVYDIGSALTVYTGMFLGLNLHSDTVEDFLGALQTEVQIIGAIAMRCAAAKHGQPLDFLEPEDQPANDAA